MPLTLFARSPFCKCLSSFLIFLSISILLTVNGCGGSGRTTPPPVQPPSNLTYRQNNITATIGTAISSDTPTVTGTVDSYTLSPTLPAGLSLNASTGVIPETPTAVSRQTTYPAAANLAGSTSAKIQITVVSNVPAPSRLVYRAFPLWLAPLSFRTSPLSAALSICSLPCLQVYFSTSTGGISGTPTAQSASATYAITATDTGGSTTANVTIAVNKALSTVLELGHSARVTLLQLQKSRLLSRDDNCHWDYALGANLASGKARPVRCGNIVVE